MQYINLRNILALLLSLGLGAAVLGQSEEAMAKGDSSAEKSSAKTDSSSASDSAEMESTEHKAKYFNSWAKSEKPGQSYSGYASNGLMLLDSALGSVIEDVRSQPVGGGPTGDSELSEDDQNQQDMATEALGQIDQHQQKLSKIADDLRDYSKISQNPTQFHEAATTTAQIFSSLQQARFPKLENDVKKLQESADKIDVTKPLAAQSKQVEGFFSDSSKIIDKMSKGLKKDAVGGGPTSDQEKKQKDDTTQPEEQLEQKDDSNMETDDLMPNME